LPAAETAADAGHELARRIAGGSRNPVSLSLRNLSDLGTAEVTEVRRVLESGLRVETGAPDEIRVTISQNFADYLLVAEMKRGEDRQVLMAHWPRAAGPPKSGQPAVSVEKTLIATLPDPILDAAEIGADWLLLQPGRVVELSGAVAALPPLTLPRDPRGRLVVLAGSYLAYLPGVICSGAVTPLDARCRETDEAWPVGVRAYFARGRNYFDGRLNGGNAVPPFYTAADGVFERVDGANLSAAWGSDITGVKCGETSFVLATRPGNGTDKDAVRVYRIMERQAVETGAPAEMPGPVTALWPLDESSAVAVARDLGSGAYAAFRLAVSCRR
jgi:hypothetical protein